MRAYSRALIALSGFVLAGIAAFGQTDLLFGQSLQVRRLVSGLSRPIFATTAPGDPSRLFIVEQRSGSTGRIRIYNLNTQSLNPLPFLSVTGLSTGGEQGLLGLAFHPNYQKNGLFYVNFNSAAAGGDTVVREYARMTADLADTSTARDVLKIAQPFTNHNGGWMGFGPLDGYLYIASGDGGSGGDPQNNAQNLTNNLLGKILRIDPTGNNGPGGTYGIPASNPFVGQSGDDEIWAYGLRNPWRCSFDVPTGDLFIADVGQGSREEINTQPGIWSGGTNFGWRVREGTLGSPLAGAVDPIYDYEHGAGPTEGFSVTGGYVYRGPIPVLQGRYFFADFVTNRIWSLNWDGSAPAAHDGTNFTDFIDWSDGVQSDVGTVASIASFGEDTLGNLYICDLGGEVFMVEDAELPIVAEGTKLLDGLVAGGATADLNASDDVDLNLEPAPTINPIKQKIDLILQATSRAANPSELSLRVEAQMTGGPVGDVTQRIRFFNYVTNNYETIDSRAAEDTDFIVVVEPVGDLSRFVQPGTLEMTVAVTWTSDEFTGPPFNWAIDVDEAVWNRAD